jgi:hypothetical protein
VRGEAGQTIRNPISALSRWKIFDNLRRSLVPLAMLLLLFVSWSTSLPFAWASLIFLASVVLLPTFFAVAADLLRKPVDLPLGMHVKVTLRSLGRPLIQNALKFVFLPYEAYISTDAIARTLVRTCWTKRRLLEWKTASDSERGADGNLGTTFRSMAFAPVLAVAAFLALAFLHHDALPFAGPWIAAWIASPLVAWWLSRPIGQRMLLRLGSIVAALPPAAGEPEAWTNFAPGLALASIAHETQYSRLFRS